MLLNIHDIPEEGLEMVCVRDLAWAREHAVTEQEVAVLPAPLRASLRFLPAGQVIVVSGRIVGDVSAPCVRCTESVVQHLDVKVDLHLRPLREVEIEADSVQLRSGELEQDFYDGQNVDVDALVAQEILLNLESYPRCPDRCKGEVAELLAERAAEPKDPTGLAAQLAALRISPQKLQ